MSQEAVGSEYYSKSDPVSVVPLGEYDEVGARNALIELLRPIGGLDFVKEGMTVIIKANLVSAMKPDEAATTHPVLLSALCDLLKEKGAGQIIIGDSPGGLYNAQHLGKVYRVTGMHDCEAHGATLNEDFSQSEAHFPEAKICNTFTYTTYLDKADVIINFCKLKSHGMMAMSCAAKNIFGVVPGVIKPEYHYRFPSYEDFADMLLDLDEYFHPTLSIADAVVGMEGNGPTAGVPKRMGALLASRSPHTLDMAAARLIGYEPLEIPTVEAAYRRGLVPERIEELTIHGDLDALLVPDFEKVVERRSLGFWGTSKNPIKNFLGRIVEKILETRPVLKKDMCVGCGVCANICPAKAIVIKDGKAIIDRKKCIRCFCCQEFCPKSAMKVKRTFIASLFHSKK
ncbi:MAG: DUF362 domain-containing protein [Clostridia bacterium]|nr:DUF362 domain-containing protein [Clostridia bacterium]